MFCGMTTPTRCKCLRLCSIVLFLWMLWLVQEILFNLMKFNSSMQFLKLQEKENSTTRCSKASPKRKCKPNHFEFYHLNFMDSSECFLFFLIMITSLHIFYNEWFFFPFNFPVNAYFDLIFCQWSMLLASHEPRDIRISSFPGHHDVDIF